MNFLSKIASAAAALAVTFAGVAPAKADQAHIELINALRAHGISIQLNNHDCFHPHEKYFGYYQGKSRLIVICNQNATQVHQTDMLWTEADLDTLRHEAQHFVQDCMIEGRHDHLMGPVYRDPVGFALSILGESKASQIVGVYRGRGAPNEVLVLELEAFAVAAANNPAEQARDIYKYCR